MQGAVGMSLQVQVRRWNTNQEVYFELYTKMIVR